MVRSDTSTSRIGGLLLAWAPPLGALSAAALALCTGSVSTTALVSLLVLYALSALGGMAADRALIAPPRLRPALAACSGLIGRGASPWLLFGLLAPAVVVAATDHTLAGALDGLLWGGLVRLFLIQHIIGAAGSACPLWQPRGPALGPGAASAALPGLARPLALLPALTRLRGALRPPRARARPS